jgi:hypothetical protein
MGLKRRESKTRRGENISNSFCGAAKRRPVVFERIIRNTMGETGEQKLLLELERLVTDENFIKLNDVFGDINIFEVTGMGSQEIKHSNMIAWLLDPNGSHRLGNWFFTKIISCLFENGDNFKYFSKKNVDVFDLIFADLSDAKVFRESDYIDLLFISHSNRFLMCIENKVWYGLSIDQLDTYYDLCNSKYNNYKRIFVLLSPNGETVPNKECDHPDEWLLLSYETIAEIIRNLISTQEDKRLKIILNDYVAFLEKRGIIVNEKLNNALSNICQLYPKATNLISDYVLNNDPIIKGIKTSLGKIKKETNKIIIWEKNFTGNQGTYYFYFQVLENYILQDKPPKDTDEYKHYFTVRKNESGDINIHLTFYANKCTKDEIDRIDNLDKTKSIFNRNQKLSSKPNQKMTLRRNQIYYIDMNKMDCQKVIYDSILKEIDLIEKAIKTTDNNPTY